MKFSAVAKIITIEPDSKKSQRVQKNNVAKKKEWTMSALYTIGQIGQAADAFENAGFTADDVTKMIQGKTHLRNFLDVIHGRAEIKTLERLIDCDAPVFVPDGWKVLPDEEQLPKRVCGQWKFDPQKISFYLSGKQKRGRICGDDLRQELTDKPMLNANVLDYLLAHPDLIPEEWKGKCIFFWGTIYRNSDGYLYVRDLDWDDSRWSWDYDWLGLDFDSGGPAALAS